MPRSSALELSSSSRMPRRWNPIAGKECCAASARTKRFPTGSGTRKFAGWWRAATLRSSRLSPLRRLPPAELVDDYALTNDLLGDARDYTAVFDMNVNIPAEHVNADSVDGGPGMEPMLEQVRDVTRKDLLILPGESSSGGASSVETLLGGTMPEILSPSFAPDSMPAGDQAAPAPTPAPSPASPEAAARRTARPAPRSEPAVTRARAASVSPRRRPRSGTASLGGIFRVTYTAHLALARSLHQRRDASHCSPPRKCVAFRRVRLRFHRLRRKPFGGGGDKLKGPDTFKESMSLPQAARWKAAADKEITSFTKHGVYELAPASSVPAGQKGVSSRWVNKIKADDLFKSRLVVLGWAQVPGIGCGGTFAPVCRLKIVRMMLAIAAELDYEVLMLDVQTAFLNVEVEKEVYVKMAPGYETYGKCGAPFVTKL